MFAAAKLRWRSSAKSMSGLATRSSTRTNADSGHGRDDQRRQRQRAAPAPVSTLPEADDQGTDPHREEHDPRVVEGAQAATCSAESRRCRQRQADGHDRERNVDVENRAPVDVLRERAADERPEGGEEGGGAGEQPERPAPLRAREHPADDRDRGRHHQRGARALHGTHDDQPLEALRGAGERGGCREHDCPDEEDATEPQKVAEPAAQHHEGSERQDVRRQHPLAVGQRRVEAADHVRDRERHRRLVDEDHAPASVIATSVSHLSRLLSIRGSVRHDRRFSQARNVGPTTSRPWPLWRLGRAARRSRLRRGNGRARSASTTRRRPTGRSTRAGVAPAARARRCPPPVRRWSSASGSSSRSPSISRSRSRVSRSSASSSRGGVSVARARRGRARAGRCSAAGQSPSVETAPIPMPR